VVLTFDLRDSLDGREESVSKLDFSFSPGFSLGSHATLKFGNRFNGFRHGDGILTISV